MTQPQQPITQDRGAIYRAVWRWHFYAGLFCIPFILWLATTGSIYLFKPQIERWLDRPYDHLQITGPRATGDAQVRAALAAVPGSNFHYYQLPATQHEAARIIVGRGKDEFRVYVHPQTLQVLKVQNEDTRPMMIVFRLHGELLMGDRGSLIVELAASWAIVLLLTGLYLWWPRQSARLAGVLFVRVRQGQRIFWRDLHAVTGLWVSLFALFLLFSGLPWAKSWGVYLQKARALSGTVTLPDWSTGRSSELAKRQARNHPEAPAHDMAHMGPMAGGQGSYEPLDRIVTAAVPYHLAWPVLIAPPMHPGAPWTAKSDSQNRTLRDTLTFDPATGALIHRENFSQNPLIDRIVETGVAAHEGQLFGLANQLLGLFTAIGLILLSISAVVLWWRRRAVGVLGAPLPLRAPRFAVWVIALLVVFGAYLPMLGLSLILVLLTERFVLSRIPATQRWLGLSPG
jgi:uncharacterized iron-regulated membrane protein